MNTSQQGFRSLLTGFYAWVSALFFGGVLLDIVYANRLRDVLGTIESTAVFSEVSDLFLLVGLGIILAAAGAIVFSWESSVARSYFIASLFVVIFEFLTPVLFAGTIQNEQGLNFGPLLRILPTGLASVLAFIGLSKYYRHI